LPGTRHLSSVTTWHSQASLLWISWTWGVSYIVPPADRIPFALLYPDVLKWCPMWIWGAILLLGATISLASERILRHSHYRPWLWATRGHMLLAGTYISLGAAATLQMAQEISGPVGSWHWCGNVISAPARTVLWVVIGYFHITYARMAKPFEKTEDSDEPT
jgi:hypothetical protein